MEIKDIHVKQKEVLNWSLPSLHTIPERAFGDTAPYLKKYKPNQMIGLSVMKNKTFLFLWELFCFL